MPIYEYRCRKCGKRFSVLTLRVAEQVTPKCKACGSTMADRLMSRFAVTKSEQARLDALSDPSTFSDLDESDPKSMARWMRKMGREMGDEFGDDEMEEMIDAVERGDEDDTVDDGL